MKKLILLLFPIIGFAQNSPEYLNELQNLRRDYQTEVSNATKDNPLATTSQIQAKYAEKENALSSKYSQIENRQRQNQQNIDSKIANQSQQRNYNQQNYDASVLQNMQNQQIQSQKYYQQEISNNLNSLSSSLQAMAYNQVKKELDRRLKVANNFAQFNSDKISKLETFYNQIPKSAFSKNLNGIYSANILEKKKYSFVNKQELVTETPALVNIENNVIKNIYLYGKENMELDLPKNNPEKSLLSNGFAVYSDYKTLSSVTVLVIDPYATNNTENYSVTKDEVSYITLWTSNKDAEGKIIYIQELDKNGNIFREISAPINYAKNEKMIDASFPKISLNSNNKLLFFGEVTSTPFGNFPLYPRMSKSDMNPLKNNEIRLVEIKKYRE